MQCFNMHNYASFVGHNMHFTRMYTNGQRTYFLNLLNAPKIVAHVFMDLIFASFGKIKGVS
jgi:hypothetical protein